MNEFIWPFYKRELHSKKKTLTTGRISACCRLGRKVFVYVMVKRVFLLQKYTQPGLVKK